MNDFPSNSRREFLSRPFQRQNDADLGEEPQGYHVVYTRRAMACDFEIRTPANRDNGLAELAMEAFDVIDAIEAEITVYNDSSVLSQLNRTASHAPVRVSPGLLDLFVVADRLHSDTDGAYDITSGPLSRAWGFSKREGRLPTNEELAAARELVGWKHVSVDEVRSTVSFDKPGIEVNFNSAGKGYALDRAVSLLVEGLEEEECNVIINGGRSTLVARGHSSGDAEKAANGWQVGLRHPLRPQERMATFRLFDEALSTSGSGTQFFRHRGKRYGHLLDPRTGQPAEGMYSATVVAKTGLLADALSTALYVMGAEAAVEFCGQHTDVKALLVVPGQHAGEVDLIECNLADGVEHSS